MSDKMQPVPFQKLLDWIFQEYVNWKSIFGIPTSKFYYAKGEREDKIFDELLETPIGPAAGPHTQLAQNIICAYLTGGRFFELKTVQKLDDLKIDKPCIDATDEGYNVEWSQELSLDESYDEYVKAWFLIHLIKDLLWLSKSKRGFVFNMSVGYDLDVDSPLPQVGVWTHVLATCDGTNLRFYVNGVLAAGPSVVTADAPVITHSEIGGWSGSYLWNGLIDDVRVYNRALSAGEIKRLYNMGGVALKIGSPSTSSGQLAQGLVGYWTFDQPDIYGANAIDRSPVGTNTGAITNGVRERIRAEEIACRSVRYGRIPRIHYHPAVIRTGNRGHRQDVAVNVTVVRKNVNLNRLILRHRNRIRHCNGQIILRANIQDNRRCRCPAGAITHGVRERIRAEKIS